MLTEDLSRLVEQGLIARYELTGRQIIVYLEDFPSEAPLAFSYRLRARFPMRAQTPPSSAYDYYNPTARRARAVAGGRERVERRVSGAATAVPGSVSRGHGLLVWAGATSTLSPPRLITC